jgi:hypothetical protein
MDVDGADPVIIIIFEGTVWWGSPGAFLLRSSIEPLIKLFVIL